MTSFAPVPPPSRAERPLVLRCEQLLPSVDGPLLRDAAVTVVGGRIVAVGPFDRDAADGASVLRCDGLVVPGMVDAHSHLRALSLSAHDIEDVPLERWLLRLLTMTALDVADEWFVAAADLLRTGVTAVQSLFHTFGNTENYLAGATSALAGVSATGIRCALGIGFTDQAEFLPEAPDEPVPAVVQELLASPRALTPTQFGGVVAEFGRRIRQEADVRGRPPRHQVVASPVAPQWCSTQALQAVQRVRRSGIRVHTHLLESAAQRDWVPGNDPVSMLDGAELVGPWLSASHAVWLSPEEVTQLAAAGASVVHCATSNRRLGVGTAHAARWLASGLNVALGLDSQTEQESPDIFEEMRSTLRSAESIGEPLTPRQVFGMATSGGARAVGWGEQLGQISVGRRADMVAVDAAVGAGHGSGDAVDGLVLSAVREDVGTVLVDGDIVVREGRIHCADEVETRRAALVAAARADAEDRRKRRADLGRAEDVAVDYIERAIRRAGRAGLKVSR